MKRLAVFPYNEDSENLIRNRKFCTDYQIVAVSSYQRDLDKIESAGHGIDCLEFKDCCRLADAILFVDSVMDYEVFGYQEKIEYAYSCDMDILMSRTLLMKLELQNEYNIKFIDNDCSIHENWNLRDKEVLTPAIGILGLGENCSKFSLQLQIKHELISKGYKVLSISSNVLGSLLGMSVIPNEIFSEDYSFQNKIKKFNSWIFDLETKYKPDIIIIGLPSGIMQLGEFCTNYYAELALVISNSLLIDYGILTLYNNFHYVEETLNKLCLMCEYKFNIHLECFVTSNNEYRINYESKEVEYRIKGNNRDFDNNDGGRNRVIDINNEEEIKLLLCYIIRQLESNLLAI